VVVLEVGSDVFSDCLNLGSEHGHLYFGRPGVGGVNAVGGDDLLTVLCGDRHVYSNPMQKV
jgi:hypothetical protein